MLFYLPLAVAALYLIDQGLLDGRLLPGFGELSFVVIVLAPTIAAWTARNRHGGALRRAAGVACGVAPLAVTGSWAAMPGSIFPRSAGLRTYLDWVTRYPNLGPINYEVLLGILCVIGTALLPWCFMLIVRTRASSTRLAATMMFAQVCMYGAVLWRVDLDQLVVGVLWSPFLIFTSHMLAGAIARLFGTAGMLYLACVPDVSPASGTSTQPATDLRRRQTP